MDWSNLSHVLQAGIVGMCALAFMLGYRSGDRV